MTLFFFKIALSGRDVTSLRKHPILLEPKFWECVWNCANNNEFQGSFEKNLSMYLFDSNLSILW